MFKLMERVTVVKHRRVLPMPAKDKATIIKAYIKRK